MALAEMTGIYTARWTGPGDRLPGFGSHTYLLPVGALSRIPKSFLTGTGHDHNVCLSGLSRGQSA